MSPVLAWFHAGCFFKDFAKILRIQVTDALAYFLDLHICIREHRLGMLHPNASEIAQEGFSCLLEPYRRPQCTVTRWTPPTGGDVVLHESLCYGIT